MAFFFQVLIHIASQSKERDFHLSVLVIFALIVKEHVSFIALVVFISDSPTAFQNAEDIVTAGRERTTAEKEKAEKELREIFENEQARLDAQKRRLLATRHSR